MIFFTSDTHFGHSNILKYCPGRDFTRIADHDEALIVHWNNTVGKDDIIYHLGDFGLMRGRKTVVKEYFRLVISRLNGKKVFIRGNHDQLFPQSMIDYVELRIPDEEMDLKQRIVLMHFPLAIWNKSHHGSWHLHGHCHDTFPSDDNTSRLDVGVDTAIRLLGEPRPFSYEEVKEHMTKKVFKPIDHHGR